MKLMKEEWTYYPDELADNQKYEIFPSIMRKLIVEEDQNYKLP